MTTAVLTSPTYPAVWNRVMSSATPEVYPEMAQLHGQVEKRRKLAKYDTGSIPIESAVVLRAFCRWLKPETIAEVGTFIGFSTEAMEAKHIFTCDKDNHCFVYPPKHIHPFGYMRSTTMFRILLERKITIDLFFFDGRIKDDDLPLIKRLSDPNTVYLFDDYVGKEKGVLNVAKLEPQLPEHVLVTSDVQPTLYGMTIAGLLPKRLVCE